MTTIAESLDKHATFASTTVNRVRSIDLLRGIIMIVMAIDHVRVYSGMPAGGPTAGIFFTRWITHYCAPGFAFFAGTSAFLYFIKTKNSGAVRKFLVTRGILLVILELTVIRFFWMFNFDYANFSFAGVIWMLGWCMVILAACVNLRPITMAIIGGLMILVQQIFSFVPSVFPESWRTSVAYIWQVFYPVALSGDQSKVLSGTSGLPNFLGLNIFYVLIPWIGVMMVGFAFGQILLMEPTKRNKLCWQIGISAIAVFLMVGTVLTLRSPSEVAFVFALLGQQKYPPSQLFLLMTLGPLIALIPWAEKARGKLVEAIAMIGRVPMFFYLMHLLIIHLSAFIVNLILFGSIHQDWYVTAPFVFVPEEQRWGLPLLYLVWIIDVIILYYICDAYARYKIAHPENPWLKYI